LTWPPCQPTIAHAAGPANHGGSYLSAGDRRILFGLGTEGKARRLTVKWPSGKEQTWEAPEPNSYWELREGEEAARRMP
jgi:hypothetical protein